MTKANRAAEMSDSNTSGSDRNGRNGQNGHARGRGSFAERAYEEILDAILDRRLPPGARLAPDELARQLGVSATPVKFALARLAGEGLVEELSPYRTVVTRLEPGALTSLYDARQLLEAAAVREHAHRITPLFLKELAAAAAAYKRVVEALEASARGAADPGARRRLVDADRAFHRVVIGLAGNPHVARWYELANTHVQANRAVHGAGALRRSVAEHAAIVDAARSRDAAQMEAAVRAHIANSARRAEELLVAEERPMLRRIGQGIKPTVTRTARTRAIREEQRT